MQQLALPLSNNPYINAIPGIIAALVRGRPEPSKDYGASKVRRHLLGTLWPFVTANQELIREQRRSAGEKESASSEEKVRDFSNGSL